MNIKEYYLNERPYTCFSTIDDEHNFNSKKNYLFDLAYIDVLSLKGENSAEFLQGQLSCDVNNVTAHTMAQGALCNLKGRVLSLIDVIQWDSMHLILPRDLLSETQKVLSKSAMFSRVELLQSDNWHIFGFYLQQSDDLIPFDIELPTKNHTCNSNQTMYCYNLGLGFYIFLVNKSSVNQLTTPFRQQKQYLGSLAWHKLRLSQKQVEIYPLSQGMFLPHRLGLHLTGHLNFDKGCYRGQEIIARTHYRAKLKHELKLFIIDTKLPFVSGDKLYHPENSREAGEVVDFCLIGKERYLLAASMLLEHPDNVLVTEDKSEIKLQTFFHG